MSKRPWGVLHFRRELQRESMQAMLTRGAKKLDMNEAIDIHCEQIADAIVKVTMNGLFLP